MVLPSSVAFVRVQIKFTTVVFVTAATQRILAEGWFAMSSNRGTEEQATATEASAQEDARMATADGSDPMTQGGTEEQATAKEASAQEDAHMATAGDNHPKAQGRRKGILKASSAATASPHSDGPKTSAESGGRDCGRKGVHFAETNKAFYFDYQVSFDRFPNDKGGFPVGMARSHFETHSPEMRTAPGTKRKIRSSERQSLLEASLPGEDTALDKEHEALQREYEEVQTSRLNCGCSCEEECDDSCPCFKAGVFCCPKTTKLSRNCTCLFLLCNNLPDTVSYRRRKDQYFRTVLEQMFGVKPKDEKCVPHNQTAQTAKDSSCEHATCLGDDIATQYS